MVGAAVTVEGDVRWHGSPPPRAAVVHGGPGAPGSAAGAARLLSGRGAVVEPLQSAGSVDGLVDELAGQLRHVGGGPLAVVGHSWGAMLGYLVAARDPEVVSALVMVASPPLTAAAEEEAQRRRMAGLSAAERGELHALFDQADEGTDARRWETWLQRTESMAPVAIESEWLAWHADVARRVWAEATRRRSHLVAEGRRIRCPVTVVHGADDPRPLAGVVDPLREVLAQLHVVVLERCGHFPWIERHAREPFRQAVDWACGRNA